MRRVTPWTVRPVRQVGQHSARESRGDSHGDTGLTTLSRPPSAVRTVAGVAGHDVASDGVGVGPKTVGDAVTSVSPGLYRRSP